MIPGKIDEVEEKAMLLAPYIMQRVIQGADYTQIASELGISRRVLYRYRQTVAFQDFSTRLIDHQLADIAESRDKGDLATAMRYREGLIKIATPRQVHQHTINTGEITHTFRAIPYEDIDDDDS